jgi:hypothetical protein
MDTLIRLAALLVIGATLLIFNVWYVRALVAVVRPREYVIAPIKLIGQDDKDGTIGAGMAQMLQTRLKMLEKSLVDAQQDLNRPVTKLTNGSAAPVPAVITLIPLMNSKAIQVPMGVLNVANVNVVVGGVQVGGLVPWIQDLLVRQQTLRFTIYGADKDARRTISGDVQPLVRDRDGSIWFQTQKSQEEALYDLAYALLQKQLGDDAGGRIDVLLPEEFRAIVDSLEGAAALNRKIALGYFVGPEEVAVLFIKLQPIAKRLPGWAEINYFAAELGERVGENDAAADFYKAFRDAAQRPDATASVKQVLKDGDIEARIQRLGSSATTVATTTAETIPEDLQSLGVKLAPASPTLSEARQTIEAEIEYACTQYDKLFRRKTPRMRPELYIVTAESHASFHYKDAIFTPALAAGIPDIVYRESVHPYLSDAGLSDVTDPQAYAIESSYADVLAYWLKERKVGGSGTQAARWVLYEGAVAWFNGGDPATDRRPLRSLQSPGSAYKSAGILGNDPQVQYYTKEAARDMNAASGISNKAFYEVATRLDLDRAAQIWVAALPELSKRVTFAVMAQATANSAKSLLGTEAQAKVQEAWQKVGL